MKISWYRVAICFLCGIITLLVIGYGIKNVQAADPRLATWVVTSTADSGPGTLREALQNAVNGDTITFDPTIFPSGNPVTITLISPLSVITQGNLSIDGSNAGVTLTGSGVNEGLQIASDQNINLQESQNIFAESSFLYVFGLLVGVIQLLLSIWVLFDIRNGLYRFTPPPPPVNNDSNR